jgi:hypothetical protein
LRPAAPWQVTSDSNQKGIDMSNRKSASQIRREWWLVCIRERPEGRQINRSHCMSMDDDLRKLIRDGVVSVHREAAHTSPFCNVRRTVVRMKDGASNPPGHISCPGCRRSASTSNQVLHKVGCPAGHGRTQDAERSKGPKTLSAFSRD